MDMIQCAFIRSEKEVVDGYILSDGEIVERLQSLSHMKEINYWQIVGQRLGRLHHEPPHP